MSDMSDIREDISKMIMDGMHVHYDLIVVKDTYELHSFRYEKANCCYIYDLNYKTKIILDQFINSNRGSSDGRKLFCFTLRWIKHHLQNVKTVQLYSLPLGLKKGHEKMSQSKLNAYYEKIGFIKISEDNLYEQNIDELIRNCEMNNMGGKTKRTKRKIKRTKTTKIINRRKRTKMKTTKRVIRE